MEGKKSTEHGIVLKENGDFSSVVGQFLFLSKCPEPYPTMTILQAELFFQTNTARIVKLVKRMYTVLGSCVLLGPAKIHTYQIRST